MVSRETSKKGHLTSHAYTWDHKEVHLESEPINKIIWSVTPSNDLASKQQMSMMELTLNCFTRLLM